MQTLYHFTAKHLWQKIKKEGLTIGGIPTSISPPEIKQGYIWLTSNDSFNQPCLEGTGRLSYKRNEVRLEVVIPTTWESRLLKFDEHKDLTPLYDDLTCMGDPENWYVFRGQIPPRWIKSKKYNLDKNGAES